MIDEVEYRKSDLYKKYLASSSSFRRILENIKKFSQDTRDIMKKMTDGGERFGNI